MRQHAILLLAVISPLLAEQGVLVLQVKDIHGQAILGLQLRAEGGSVSAPTDVAGVARILLSTQTKPGARLALQLVRPPRDLVFISPWDAQVMVPPFDSAKEVLIVLANRGDRAMLEDGSALSSLTAKLLKSVQPPPRNEMSSDDQRRRDALAEVSKTYGLSPEELDKAMVYQTFGPRPEPSRGFQFRCHHQFIWKRARKAAAWRLAGAPLAGRISRSA